jgi:basic membrane protein A
LVLTIFTLIGCGGNTGEEENEGTTAENSSPAENTQKEKDFEVAMVMTGPINDAGWCESAYKGLMTAKDKYQVEIAYSENVAQPDIDAVIRDYADKGYDLIICHGFEFSDPVKAISPEYPESIFAVVNGDSYQDPNMVSMRFNTPQTGFIAGTVAALISETNVVGMIGGTKMPHIQDALLGFEAGAKYVNPDIKVLTGFTESMDDLAKGKEMAMAMIEQGADVTCANANQAALGVIDAAKSQGIKHLGYISDQYEVEPDTIFVSVIQSVEDMIVSIVDKAVNGEAKAALYLMGVNDGAVRLSDFHGNESKLPEGAMDKINEAIEAIKDGSLKEKGILPKSVFEQ